MSTAEGTELNARTSGVGVDEADPEYGEDEGMVTTGTRKKKVILSSDKESLLAGKVPAKCCGCSRKGCGCCWILVALVIIVCSSMRSTCFSIQDDCGASGSPDACYAANHGFACKSVYVPRSFYASDTWDAMLQPTDTKEKARAYYEQQLAYVGMSAMDFECLDYWCQNFSAPAIETPFYDLVTNRYDNMLAKYTADADADDFRFEKNKCEMYNWLARNQFRHNQIMKMWSAEGQWNTPIATKDSIVSDLIDDPALTESFPMFMKACHITQGWEHSVKYLRSHEWLEENREAVAEWMGTLWDKKANDWARQWVVPHNALTDTLVQGALVQKLYPGHFIELYEGDPTVADVDGTVVEVKVHTIWGRAYMATCHNIVFLRDNSIEIYDGFWRATIGHGHRDSPWLRWVVSEGHLDRAWVMAETAALTVGMDMVRLDFFMRKGEPDAIVYNENSISSARDPKYRHHYDYMSRIWAMGYTERWFRRYVPPEGEKLKRTYEISRLDAAHPNKRRLDEYLAANEAIARATGLWVDVTA